jgi:hypothetical protein
VADVSWRRRRSRSWLVVVRRLIEGDDRSFGALLDRSLGYPHRAFICRARQRPMRHISGLQRRQSFFNLSFGVVDIGARLSSSKLLRRVTGSSPVCRRVGDFSSSRTSSATRITSPQSELQANLMIALSPMNEPPSPPAWKARARSGGSENASPATRDA